MQVQETSTEVEFAWTICILFVCWCVLWQKVTGQGDQQLGFPRWWRSVNATSQRSACLCSTAIVPWLHMCESGDKAASTVCMDIVLIMHCLCITFACAFLQLYFVCLIWTQTEHKLLNFYTQTESTHHLNISRKLNVLVHLVKCNAGLLLNWQP